MNYSDRNKGSLDLDETLRFFFVDIVVYYSQITQSLLKAPWPLISIVTCLHVPLLNAKQSRKFLCSIVIPSFHLNTSHFTTFGKYISFIKRYANFTVQTMYIELVSLKSPKCLPLN